MLLRRTYLLFALACVLFARAADASRCRISDLQTCLDSACMEHGNPASRCYMCGTSAAEGARPPEDDRKSARMAPQMTSLSMGGSSRNTISDKDLKDAPTKPEDRYMWAQSTCLGKLSDCSEDDVEENYDKLLGQACNIAMNDLEFNASILRSKEKKTEDTCNAELSQCLLRADRCGPNMLGCADGDNTDFNRNFSACAVDVGGCDDFTTDLRSRMLSQRDEMVNKRDERVQELAELRKNERENRLQQVTAMCQEDRGFNACVMEMCGNFPIGLVDGMCQNQEEARWARQICAFVSTACQRLK